MVPRAARTGADGLQSVAGVHPARQARRAAVGAQPVGDRAPARGPAHELSRRRRKPRPGDRRGESDRAGDLAGHEPGGRQASDRRSFGPRIRSRPGAPDPAYPGARGRERARAVRSDAPHRLRRLVVGDLLQGARGDLRRLLERETLASARDSDPIRRLLRLAARLLRERADRTADAVLALYAGRGAAGDRPARGPPAPCHPDLQRRG